MAREGELGLREGERLAGGNTKLPFDEVDAAHHLRHRVLHLPRTGKREHTRRPVREGRSERDGQRGTIREGQSERDIQRGKNQRGIFREGQSERSQTIQRCATRQSRACQSSPPLSLSPSSARPLTHPKHTCSRVFISMKKKLVGSSASAMNSTVPAPS